MRDERAYYRDHIGARRESARRYRETHLEEVRARGRQRYASSLAIRADRRAFDIQRRALANFLIRAGKSEGCVDCGELDPVVLDYDHVGPKIRQVTDMQRHSLAKLVNEIAKCEVRCANCHRRVTAQRRVAA